MYRLGRGVGVWGRGGESSTQVFHKKYTPAQNVFVSVFFWGEGGSRRPPRSRVFRSLSLLGLSRVLKKVFWRLRPPVLKSPRMRTLPRGPNFSYNRAMHQRQKESKNRPERTKISHFSPSGRLEMSPKRDWTALLGLVRPHRPPLALRAGWSSYVCFSGGAIPTNLYARRPAPPRRCVPRYCRLSVFVFSRRRRRFVFVFILRVVWRF